jgi:hypothetical protein
MKALREAAAALRAFLRGFVGMHRDSDRIGDGRQPPHARHPNATSQAVATPASVRAALAARAAGRGTCC